MYGELRGDVPRRGVVDIVIIGVLGSLVQLLCCVSGVGVGCCVRGGGFCLFVRCWWVFGRRLPLWGGASCCCTLSEPCLLRSQPGISRLEGRVVTGRLFVCCPGFPLPALDFSLGFFVSRQGSLLAFTVGDYMHLTLYWPYCRSFRVEGFAPRNPTFAWVSVVLSRCRWLRC